MSTEVIKIKGFVTVYDIPSGFVVPKDYRNLPIVLGADNVITDLGLNRAAELLGGLSTDFIDDMAIGDAGTNPSDPTIALAPDPSDTALGNELIEKSIGSKSVTDNVLTMSTTFLTTEGPFPFLTGMVVNEYGLKASDGVLIARKTSGSIPFAPSSRSGIIVEWRITLL